MLKLFAKLIISALQEGEFLDKLSDLIVDRLKARSGLLTNVKETVLNQVNQRFEGMGMTGVFVKRLLQDQLDELIAVAQEESDGVLTVRDLPRVLDGISDQEIEAAREILTASVRNSINRAMAEKQ